jgi:DNA invertase Pin-like site-specific DNA recombinase
MQRLGIELVPTDAPTHFTDPTPTAEMVRQILGAVSQFEKASLVAKLRHARDRVRAELGRCEGRKPVPAEVVVLAKKLARISPKTGKRRSFVPLPLNWLPKATRRRLAVRTWPKAQTHD